MKPGDCARCGAIAPAVGRIVHAWDCRRHERPLHVRTAEQAAELPAMLTRCMEAWKAKTAARELAERFTT